MSASSMGGIGLLAWCPYCAKGLDERPVIGVENGAVFVVCRGCGLPVNRGLMPLAPLARTDRRQLVLKLRL